MATEEGIVTATSATSAWVKTVRASACHHCSARHSCSPNGNGENLVEAENPVHAKVGDRILVSIETIVLLKASFLIYVFPILCLMVGAIIGQGIGPGMGLNGSWTSPALGGLFFITALFIMKSRGNRLAKSAAYKPKIIRILTPAVPAKNFSSCPTTP